MSNLAVTAPHSSLASFYRRGSERFALLVIFAALTPLSLFAQERKLTYPATRQVDQVDQYHGVKIPDPYRWLEDPNSDETKAWVAAQNKVTQDFLRSIPARANIEKRLTQLWNFERYGLPQKLGTHYFFTRNDGLQDQSVLYVADSLDGEPRVLLDPNKLSKDGTVALASWSPSDDGKYVACALSTGGSDWRTWRIIEVSTNRWLDEQVEWSKFSGASWLPDSSGFVYARYDAPKEGQRLTGRNEFQKLYLHQLRTPQAEDTLLYERKDEPSWGFGGTVTEDGRYLVISVYQGTLPKNQVFYKELAKPDAPVVELITGFDAKYNFLGNVGPRFYFQTDHEAPLGRIIAVDLPQPARSGWKEIVPTAKSVLSSASYVGQRLICNYLEDARSRVKVFDLNGKFVRDVALPGVGTAGGFGGLHDAKETFFAFESFTAPHEIYRYEIATGESTLFRRPKVDFNPDDFETTQVFCTSKDGTRVPMFISHKKGLKLDGQNPTILYGYGGFNIPLSPAFHVTNLVWMEMGGVYASVNLRGGGEYGRAWYEAGIQAKKQNVFDDFIAAAQWLIAHKYTSPEKLAARGGSNGGLLVGAVMTQRPDLFAAALPAVGVLDMLRYHRYTIGWAWVSDYGSSEKPDEFKTLLAYSPLHNLKPGTKYPATLITTGDHDDRVVPAHSFKFAAALQAAHAGDAPVLIRIETSSGHGAGTPISKIIDEAADRLAFLVQVLGMPAE